MNAEEFYFDRYPNHKKVDRIQAQGLMVDYAAHCAGCHPITPNEAAKLLGSLTSPLKASTARENGKLGGRPRKLPKASPEPSSRDCEPF